MAKKGLGKGLGAIFGEETVREERAKREMKKQENQGGELLVKIDLVQPNKEQPRKTFHEEQMQELAESIRKHGIIQPILVQKKDTFYEIVAGERRWRAARMAGLKEVPVILREYSRQESMEIALIENVQRADLNPIEEAKAYQQLIQEFGLKQEDIAERVAKNRVTITNSLRLLKLDDKVQELLSQGAITGGHARAILGLEKKSDQRKAVELVIEGALSVRETERLVKRMVCETGGEKKKTRGDEQLELVFQNLEDRMKDVMGTKVTIHNRDKNKGRVEIEYYSQAELERIVEMIESIR